MGSSPLQQHAVGTCIVCMSYQSWRSVFSFSRRQNSWWCQTILPTTSLIIYLAGLGISFRRLVDLGMAKKGYRLSIVALSVALTCSVATDTATNK